MDRLIILHIFHYSYIKYFNTKSDDCYQSYLGYSVILSLSESIENDTFDFLLI